jgi:hypothetical protein
MLDSGEQGGKCRLGLTARGFHPTTAGLTQAALQVLAECPPEMGFSYPANAGWRLWALAKGAELMWLWMIFGSGGPRWSQWS